MVVLKAFHITASMWTVEGYASLNCERSSFMLEGFSIKYAESCGAFTIAFKLLTLTLFLFAVRLLLTDPRLALTIFFAPCIPSHYRLMGHGAWPGARDAILTTMDRIYFPLKTRATSNNRKSQTMKIFIFAAVVAIFLLFLNWLTLYISWAVHLQNIISWRRRTSRACRPTVRCLCISSIVLNCCSLFRNIILGKTWQSFLLSNVQLLVERHYRYLFV